MAYTIPLQTIAPSNICRTGIANPIDACCQSDVMGYTKKNGRSSPFVTGA
jgi:hypothetical protein